jgi:hypothetical protein
MFNAIFGNFFRTTSATSSQYAEASTQTSSQNEPVLEQTTDIKNINEVNSTNYNTTDTSLDWVIVDPAEEADLKETKESEAVKENDSTLVGSFFDKNLNETKIEVDAPKKEDSWLITPLPCLTSITCSQRSIVENDPLENLLIEHPSMSVFISATGNQTSFMAHVTTIDEEDNFKSEEIYEKLVVQKKKEKKQHSPSQTVEADKKKEKKSKKFNNSKISPNKENLQVKNLLLNEFKKSNLAVSRSQLVSVNRNQMKRSNNSATFSSLRNNVNANQRKYHKLHQPIVYNFQQF